MIASFSPTFRFFRNGPFRRTVLFALLSAFLLVGCDKDELKKPTRVRIRFKVDDQVTAPSGNNGQGNAAPFSLKVNGGTISIDRIRIKGERKGAENVDFAREDEIDIPIEKGTAEERTYFELPQGTYQDLSISLRLQGAPAISCKGERIEKAPNKATSFHLSVKEKRTVKSSVVSKGSVELDKDRPRTIEVELKVGEWFQGIPEQLWKNAAVDQGPNGKERIMIQKGENTSIHDKVLQRIENAFKTRLL